MIRIKESLIIAQDKDYYLSFPDIIQSIKQPNRYFIVYREGNAHHPTWSKLILKRSEDYGRTWRNQQEFPLNIEDDGYVWNCPRLSYIGNILYIICDAKSSTFERQCNFKTIFLTSTTEGKFFRSVDTPFPGMVPDKIIKFKDKFFCANHKIKSSKNDLIQLISWSKDSKLWYDTNTVANDSEHQYCEASIVNMDNVYMTAYLRDNSGHKKYIYTAQSKDGINWSRPKKIPIFGQRVTAIKKNKNTVVGAYRNTDVLQVSDTTSHVKLSLFSHNLDTNKVESHDIDWEYARNQYHFGYTGLAETEKEYLVVYYIRQDKYHPYIKLVFINKKNI